MAVTVVGLQRKGRGWRGGLGRGVGVEGGVRIRVGGEIVLVLLRMGGSGRMLSLGGLTIRF